MLNCWVRYGRCCVLPSCFTLSHSQGTTKALPTADYGGAPTPQSRRVWTLKCNTLKLNGSDLQFLPTAQKFAVWDRGRRALSCLAATRRLLSSDLRVRHGDSMPTTGRLGPEICDRLRNWHSSSLFCTSWCSKLYPVKLDGSSYIKFFGYRWSLQVKFIWCTLPLKTSFASLK